MVLVHCFAGCTPYEVVRAVGMELHELFPRRQVWNGARRAPLDARTGLFVIAREALLVRLYAESVLDGGLTNEEKARLRLAESRIREVYGNVR